MKSSRPFTIELKKATMITIQRAHAKYQKKAEDYFKENRHIKDHASVVARNNVIGKYWVAMNQLMIAFRIVQATPTNDAKIDTNNIINGEVTTKRL